MTTTPTLYEINCEKILWAQGVEKILAIQAPCIWMSRRRRRRQGTMRAVLSFRLSLLVAFLARAKFLDDPSIVLVLQV